MMDVLIAFMEGMCGCKHPYILQDKELRAHLSEQQIDKMVQDSFPASDPPSTY